MDAFFQKSVWLSCRPERMEYHRYGNGQRPYPHPIGIRYDRAYLRHHRYSKLQSISFKAILEETYFLIRWIFCLQYWLSILNNHRKVYSWTRLRKEKAAPTPSKKSGFPPHIWCYEFRISKQRSQSPSSCSLFVMFQQRGQTWPSAFLTPTSIVS